MSQALSLSVKGLCKTKPNTYVGCVNVQGSNIVGQGYHSKAGGRHAEIIALEEAGDLSRNADLYVTLEPCVMCLGAIMHARINRIVFGASDPKTGVCGSKADLTSEAFFTHKIKVDGGVLEAENKKILQSFFKSKRKEKNLKSVHTTINM